MKFENKSFRKYLKTVSNRKVNGHFNLKDVWYIMQKMLNGGCCDMSNRECKSYGNHFMQVAMKFYKIIIIST